MATTNLSFDVNLKNRSELRDGPLINYKGQYQPANYFVGDVVSLDETLYVSLIGECGNPNTEPLTDTLAWALFSKPVDSSSVTLNYDNANGNIETVNQTGIGQYDFIVPPKVHIISVYMIAGGGSGGSGRSQYDGFGFFFYSGGGGGSGHILQYDYPTNPGQVISFEVGQGGQGVTEPALGSNGNRSRMLVNGNVIATTLGGSGGGSITQPYGGAGFYGGAGGQAVYVANGDSSISTYGFGGAGVMENGTANQPVIGGTGQGGGEGGFSHEPGGGGGPGGGDSNTILNGHLPGAGGCGAPPHISVSPSGANGQIIISW